MMKKNRKVLVCFSLTLIVFLLATACGSTPDWAAMTKENMEETLIEYGSGNVEFHIDKLSRYLTEDAVIYYFQFHGVADFSTEEQPNQIEDFGTHSIYYYEIDAEKKEVRWGGRVMMNNLGNYQPANKTYIAEAYEAALESNLGVYEYTADELKSLEKQMTFLSQ